MTPTRRRNPGHFTGTVDWHERLDALQARPGEWDMLRVFDSFQQVGSLLQSLKRKARRRGGEWEFTTRKQPTSGFVALYGRCVTPPPPPPPAPPADPPAPSHEGRPA